jgi:HicA toxin of bacterial toxin-antitoxin,
MNTKHRTTLRKIYTRPTAANVRWNDLEGLMKALGATIQESSGSRMRFCLGDLVAVFHRPHPSPYMRKGAVDAARRLPQNCGVKP